MGNVIDLRQVTGTLYHTKWYQIHLWTDGDNTLNLVRDIVYKDRCKSLPWDQGHSGPPVGVNNAVITYPQMLRCRIFLDVIHYVVLTSY